MPEIVRPKLNPVDVSVGSRLRIRRVQCAMSHETLAEQLSTAVETLRRYETGELRLGASLLLQASEALRVPVSYFFQEINQKNAPVADILTTREFLEMARKSKA